MKKKLLSILCAAFMSIMTFSVLCAALSVPASATALSIKETVPTYDREEDREESTASPEEETTALYYHVAGDRYEYYTYSANGSFPGYTVEYSTLPGFTAEYITVPGATVEFVTAPTYVYEYTTTYTGVEIQTGISYEYYTFYPSDSVEIITGMFAFNPNAAEKLTEAQTDGQTVNINLGCGSSVGGGAVMISAIAVGAFLLKRKKPD